MLSVAATVWAEALAAAAAAPIKMRISPKPLPAACAGRDTSDESLGCPSSAVVPSTVLRLVQEKRPRATG
jgi:hypothetical protein